MSDFPAIGEEVGGYRLLRSIGRGGMGAVYEAVHGKLGRIVAIKILPQSLASDQEFVSRFFHEARIVNEVRHPNIVDVFDFIDVAEPRRVAYVMEYLPGVPLGTLIEAKALGVRQSVQVALQLSAALKSVHARNVVHRDLKPDNVIVIHPVEALGVVPSVKVLDFGIAKVQDESSVSHRTGTGALLGTPRYMAPEQIAGSKVTSAADVYALAEVFCEMVTGRRLFSAANQTILKQKLLGELPPVVFPDHVKPKAAILELLQACLRTEPSERPTLDAVERALYAIADAQGTEDSRGVSYGPLLSTTSRRRGGGRRPNRRR